MTVSSYVVTVSNAEGVRISIEDARQILENARDDLGMIEQRFGFGPDEKRLRAGEPLRAVQVALNFFLNGDGMHG